MSEWRRGLHDSVVGDSRLKLIWFSFLVNLFITAFLKENVGNVADELGMLAVLTHIIFVMLVLFVWRHKYKSIFLTAFSVRVAAMFWDLYASHIFFLPGSGADSVGFFDSAVRISRNLGLLFESIYGGYYAKLNGLLFYAVGPQRIWGQYLNVLLGLSTVYVIYAILSSMSVDASTKKYVMRLAALFPYSIVMSAIFLREILITFLVSVSLYMFVQWCKTKKSKFIFWSLVFLGFGSIFHSGVMGIAVGYSFAFLFYNNADNRLRFSGKSVVSFAILLVMFSLAFTVFEDKLLGKFDDLESADDLYRIATPSGHGGSAYLTGITINNPLELAVFGPIKSFYFLASPLPQSWRGLIDVLTFTVDSLFYLGVLFYFVKNRQKLDERKVLATVIVVMIVGVTAVFGIGVSNAGTAVRHRQKLIPIFLVLLATVMDGKSAYLAKYRAKEANEIIRMTSPRNGPRVRARRNLSKGEIEIQFRFSGR